MSNLRLYSHNFIAIMEIYIESEGCNDPGISGCGHATIRVNGKDHSKHMIKKQLKQRDLSKPQIAP